MKIKFIPLLLACMLITGCAQTPSDTQDPATAESTVSETMESNSAETDITGDAASESGETTTEESDKVIFTATTIDGETLTSDCFADSKLTMINIWATYCNPCLVEMPYLGAIATEYDKSDFQLIGLISDVMDYDNSVDYDEVIALIKDVSADTFPHLIGNRDLTLEFLTFISGVPTTFFVNQDSEILGYVVGSQTKETWIEIIDGLLAEME